MKKNKWIIIAIVSLLVISLTSFFVVRFVELSKKNKKEEIVPNNPQQQMSVLPSSQQRTVITDNLKMRKDPNLNADAVATLNIGDKVDIIKIGDSKIKIAGRENYWYNVSFRGSTGWIFGDDIASKDNIDELVKTKFGKYLDSLSKNEIDSSLRGLKMYGIYANLTTNKNTNDELFRQHEKFQNSIILSKTQEELIQKYGGYTEDYIQKNADKDYLLLRNKLAQNGFRIMASRGIGYITTDERFMFLSVGNTLSEGLREYLQIMVSEISNYPLFENNTLNITWNQLSDRIIKLENLIEKYPSLLESKYATIKVKTYITTYLGMSKYLVNTKIFADDRLVDDVKSSYERFISNYPNSKYYEVVKGYYDTLKRYEFEDNEEARSFLKSKGITEEE